MQTRSPAVAKEGERHDQKHIWDKPLHLLTNFVADDMQISDDRYET